MSHHSGSQRCSDVAALGLFQGLFTGAGFGLFLALYQRRIHPDAHAAKQAMRAMGESLFLFSSLLSVYHGVTCVSSRVRRRDDVVNAVLGGCAAGLVVSLPTRTPRLIAQNSLGMGVIGTVMDRIANPPVQSAAAAATASAMQRAAVWQQKQWSSSTALTAILCSPACSSLVSTDERQDVGCSS